MALFEVKKSGAGNRKRYWKGPRARRAGMQSRRGRRVRGEPKQPDPRLLERQALMRQIEEVLEAAEHEVRRLKKLVCTHELGTFGRINVQADLTASRARVRSLRSQLRQL